MNILEKVEEFSKEISGKIFLNYDLKKSNWFGLGGPAKIYFKPNNLNELILFIKQFSAILPIKVMGAGSNILIRDGGFDGAIIKLGKNFSNISKLNETTIISGSSVLDKNLSEFARDHGISGLEFFSCIPGTIGGAIRMNSGCYECDVSNSLISIQVLDKKGIVKSIGSNHIKFFYRGSNLSRDLIFLSATFRGQKSDSKIINEKIKTLVLEKKKTQPSRIKTCGSTFRNPIDQTTKKSWQLIKESACEKLFIGGAHISSQHLNFFINNGKATASDMENLINLVKKRVLVTTGIKLDLELEIIGKKI